MDDFMEVIRDWKCIIDAMNGREKLPNAFTEEEVRKLFEVVFKSGKPESEA